MSESWKAINEAPKFYISSFGRVWNDELKVYVKPYLHKSRCSIYPRFCLRGHKIMAHVLSAKYYCANPLNLKQVDHEDNNTLNYNPTNLSWVSESDNKKKSWVMRRQPELGAK